MVAVSTTPTPTPTRPPGAVLEAVLERLTYVNEETGYTVAKVATSRGGDDLLTVVGALLGAQPGESLRLCGRWSSHPKFGRQFEVESYTTVLPATIQGIQRYLGSGLVKGIGPAFAQRIVAHFGLDTLRVIEEQPGRLIEVPGLGPKRTAKITTAWEEQKAIKEVMVFLQGVGVSTSLAVRIFKKYADASISVVRNEPYRLAADVWGIGFKTADTIAQAVGIAHDSPERVKAGLQYTLSQATDDGHCYLPQPQLVTDAAKILGVPTDLIGTCLDELVTAEGVVREALPGQDGPVPAVYLVAIHRAETALAGSLLRLLRERCGCRKRHPPSSGASADVQMRDRGWIGDPRWSLAYGDTRVGQHGVEGVGGLAGPVADEDVELLGPVAEVHEQVAGLLSGPGPVRVAGDAEDVQVAAADLQDEEHVPALHRAGAVDVEVVAGQHGRGLSRQELSAGGVVTARRCRWDAEPVEDPTDRGRARLVAEAVPFALDACVAPAGIVTGHLLDQGDVLGSAAAGEQGQPFGAATQREVAQAQRHEQRSCPTGVRAAAQPRPGGF